MLNPCKKLQTVATKFESAKCRRPEYAGGKSLLCRLYPVVAKQLCCFGKSLLQGVILLKNAGTGLYPHIADAAWLSACLLFFGSLNFFRQIAFAIAMKLGAFFVDTVPCGDGLLVGIKPRCKHSRVHGLKRHEQQQYATDQLFHGSKNSPSLLPYFMTPVTKPHIFFSNICLRKYAKKMGAVSKVLLSATVPARLTTPQPCGPAG